MRSSISYTTDSEDATIALGRQLGRQLPRRCVVLLIGNLGAGKTTLAKGILNGMGLAEKEEVTSPTFTLIHEYGPNADGGRAYHIDLYRLDRAEQIATLGLDEIFDREAVVLIEWGERFPQLMPAGRIEIRLTPDSQNPDSQNPDSQNPDSQNPDSQNPDSQNPDSQNEDSRRIEVRNL